MEPERPAVAPVDPFAGDPDACFNPEEAAAFLGYSPRTLCTWRNRGIGPEFGAGENGYAVRYRRCKLVEWQEQREARARALAQAKRDRRAARKRAAKAGGAP